MNVAPLAVFQTLKAMCAGQKVSETSTGDASTASHTTTVPSEPRGKCYTCKTHGEQSIACQRITWFELENRWKQHLCCSDGTFVLQLFFLVISVWLPIEEESVVSGKSAKTTAPPSASVSRPPRGGAKIVVYSAGDTSAPISQGFSSLSLLAWFSHPFFNPDACEFKVFSSLPWTIAAHFSRWHN